MILALRLVVIFLTRSASEDDIYVVFIVRVDDVHGPDDLLNLIVEVKGYRREDAKDKKATMETYWVPGVNNLGTYGRWAFAELCDVYEMELDFDEKIEPAVGALIDRIAKQEAPA